MPAPITDGVLPLAPLKDGFYKGETDLDPPGSTAGLKTCFLSKKTWFTMPHKPMPNGCQTTTDLANVAKKMVNSDCASCLKQMDRHLHLSNFKKDGKTELWKMQKGEPGFSLHLPSECTRCDAMWNKLCLPKGDADTDEMRKQDYMEHTMVMLGAARKLVKHGVALYLDFADKVANDMIEMYGGREEAFKWPALYEAILALLKKRAYEADSFVHWEGAGGNFCLAEQAGIKQSFEKWGTMQTLHFPPLASAKPGSAGHFPPECRYDPEVGWPSASLVEHICSLCGGSSCTSICASGAA